MELESETVLMIIRKFMIFIQDILHPIIQNQINPNALSNVIQMNYH